MTDHDVTPTPHEFDREDTGPIRAALVEAHTAAPGATTVTVHDIAAALHALGGNGGGPPPKKFLALSGGEWTKFLLTVAIAGLIAVAGWLLIVRDAIRESVKKPALIEQFEKHSATPHPGAATKEAVRYIRVEVSKIQITQAKTNTEIEHIGGQIDGIAKDVRRIRRRGR